VRRLQLVAQPIALALQAIPLLLQPIALALHDGLLALQPRDLTKQLLPRVLEPSPSCHVRKKARRAYPPLQLRRLRLDERRGQLLDREAALARIFQAKRAARGVAAGGARRSSSRGARSGSDGQLEEFETRDLGKDMRAAGTGRFVHVRARATSIVLESVLIAALRRKDAKRGLGYQTMLKVIVREHLHEY
jgi:predicted DNA binding CopG/RHH family protein